MKKIVVLGAGGFIGGHLVKKILDNGNSVIATDIKPKEYWFQDFDVVDNHYSTDMKDISNCRKVTKDVDYVFNMACNMGGMGFIENNKAECMQSVLINTNLLIASRENKIKKYFFSSSACAYNIQKQQGVFIEGLKAGDKLDGEGGFCARGRLITSKKSKKEMILPLGLSDDALLKRDIKKDEVIKLNDVELNLPSEVIEARNYQYKLI